MFKNIVNINIINISEVIVVAVIVEEVVVVEAVEIIRGWIEKLRRNKRDLDLDLGKIMMIRVRIDKWIKLLNKRKDKRKKKRR